MYVYIYIHTYSLYVCSCLLQDVVRILVEILEGKEDNFWQSLWDFNFNVGSSDNKVHKVPISIHWLIIIFPNKLKSKKNSNVRQTHVYHRSHVPFQGVPQLPRLLAESSLRLALWWEPQGSIVTHWPLEVGWTWLYVMINGLVYTLGHDFGTWSNMV